MSLARKSHRILAIALLASTCLLTIAPAAEAGRRHRGHRHKGSHAWCRVDHHAHNTVVVRSSGPGPVLAGLVGGFIIGTAYARSAPVVHHPVVHAPAPRYRYWDPYCDTWFVSLADCRHGSHGGHAQIVKVYDHDDGRYVRTMRWSAGAWYDI